MNDNDEACSCKDKFSSLPAELRPKASSSTSGLRSVTCPKCGIDYWTNRSVDLCLSCVKAKESQRAE